MDKNLWGDSNLEKIIQAIVLEEISGYSDLRLLGISRVELSVVVNFEFKGNPCRITIPRINLDDYGRQGLRTEVRKQLKLIFRRSG